MKELDSVKFQELKLLELSIKLYEASIKPKPNPCPFCGEKEIKGKLDRKRGMFCYCTNCLASGPYGQLDIDAIQAWNKRT